MTTRTSTSDTGFGVALSVSTVTHLAVFLLLVWWSSLFPQHLQEQPTYYVDLVNLPVAAPQSGSPAPHGPATEPAPEPPKTQTAPMALPAKTKPAAKPATASKTPAQDTAASDAAAVEERMKKMQSKVDAQQYEAALKRLNRPQVTSGTSRSGIPEGKGSEQGSDYLSYITSRLTDAFSEPPNVSKTAYALIKIRIVKSGSKGKLDRIDVVRRSGNISFDNYAVRSAYDAEPTFPAPPSGAFEFTFKFRPQGISSK